MTHGRRQISVEVALVNALMTLAFLALAHYANHCLQQRDDKARRSKLAARGACSSRSVGRPGAVGGAAAGLVRKSSQISIPTQPTVHHAGTTAAVAAAPHPLPAHQGASTPPATNVVNASTSLLSTPSHAGSSRRLSVMSESEPKAAGSSSKSFQPHFPSTDSEDSDDDDGAVQVVDRLASAKAIPRDSFTGLSAATALSSNDSQALSRFVMTDKLRLFRCRTAMLRDLRSCFFIGVIILCILSAITTLIFTYADVSSSITTSDRRVQDVITTPQACALFMVYASLLHILHVLVEQEISRTFEGRFVSVRLIAGLSVIVAAYVFALVYNLVGSRGSNAPEYVSTTFEVLLSLLFFWTSLTLPAKIRSFGAELLPTAQKVRRVSLVVAAALLIRFVTYFPLLQDEYGGIGPYVQLVLQLVDIIPLTISLLFLHLR